MFTFIKFASFIYFCCIKTDQWVKSCSLMGKRSDENSNNKTTI